MDLKIEDFASASYTSIISDEVEPCPFFWCHHATVVTCMLGSAIWVLFEFTGFQLATLSVPFMMIASLNGMCFFFLSPSYHAAWQES